MAQLHDAAFAPDDDDLFAVDAAIEVEQAAHDTQPDATVHPIVRATQRPCARPACPAPARATLQFDYDLREVYVDALVEVADPQAYDLCVTHADRSRPPHGWQLRDRRSEEDRLPDTPPAKPTDLGSERTVAVLAAALRAVPTPVPEDEPGLSQVTENASEGAGVHLADGGSPERPASAEVLSSPDSLTNASAHDDIDVSAHDDIDVPTHDDIGVAVPPIEDDPEWLDVADDAWEVYDRSGATEPSSWDHELIGRGTRQSGAGCGQAGCADEHAVLHHDSVHSAASEQANAMDVSTGGPSRSVDADVAHDAVHDVGRDRAHDRERDRAHDIDAPTLFASESRESPSNWDMTMEHAPTSLEAETSLTAPAWPTAQDAHDATNTEPPARVVRVSVSDEAPILPGGPGFPSAW